MKQSEFLREPYEVPKITPHCVLVERGFQATGGVGTTDPEPGDDDLEGSDSENWSWEA